MGVFGWLVYLALSQEDATDGKGDGSVIIVAVFLVAVGQISPCGSAELPAFAMQSHAQVIPPYDYVAKTVTKHYHLGKFNTTGVNFDEEAVRQN
jgi:hypothetical protein